MRHHRRVTRWQRGRRASGVRAGLVIADGMSRGEVAYSADRLLAGQGSPRPRDRRLHPAFAPSSGSLSTPRPGNGAPTSSCDARLAATRLQTWLSGSERRRVVNTSIGLPPMQPFNGPGNGMAAAGRERACAPRRTERISCRPVVDFYPREAHGEPGTRHLAAGRRIPSTNAR